MMFWEIIATVISGFLLAGLVLPLRLIFKKLPKWIVPLAAGIGMMGFQVFSEYTWADDMIAKLPKDSVVVAKVPQSKWYSPWSYAYPQVLQFVVLDKSKISDITPTSKQATLYFFERRAAAHPMGITVDCQNPNLSFDAQTSQRIVEIVCHNKP